MAAARIEVMPIALPSVRAVSRPLSAMPNTGLRVASRAACRPGSEKQAMTKAAARLSCCSTRRQSGATTSSTWRWVSMPGGPSARARHSISGPPALRNDSTAVSIARVTASLLLGLMTMMRSLMRGQCSRILGATQTGRGADLRKNVSRETLSGIPQLQEMQNDPMDQKIELVFQGDDLDHFRSVLASSGPELRRFGGKEAANARNSGRAREA